MKPRIFMDDGIWQCKLDRQGFKDSGFGSTPAEAYADWLDWNEVLP